MDKRLSELYKYISSGDTFADVGCDHGYIAERVLQDNKFKNVIISDISEKCLNKAKLLLTNYSQRILSYVSDGFKEFEGKAQEAIIAGMGGDEIVSILNGVSILPNRLILSPQKNVENVRKELLLKGFAFEKDYVFFDGYKYYNCIVCSKGIDNYTEDEILFGRDNLIERSSDFLSMLKDNIDFYETVLKNDSINELSKKQIEIKLNKIKKVYENK